MKLIIGSNPETVKVELVEDGSDIDILLNGTRVAYFTTARNDGMVTLNTIRPNGSMEGIAVDNDGYLRVELD